MLREIQEKQKPWVKHNFGDRPAWMPLLGVVEELGELAHSYLKREQGIRTEENHDKKIKDAVGDIVLFLMDFCSANNIDLQSVVSDTWEQAKERDWKANPKSGIKEDTITYTHKPDNSREVLAFIGEKNKYTCKYCGGYGEYDTHFGIKGCDLCNSRLIPFIDFNGKMQTVDWGDSIIKREDGSLELSKANYA